MTVLVNNESGLRWGISMVICNLTPNKFKPKWLVLANEICCAEYVNG